MYIKYISVKLLKKISYRKKRSGNGVSLQPVSDGRRVLRTSRDKTSFLSLQTLHSGGEGQIVSEETHTHCEL